MEVTYILGISLFAYISFTAVTVSEVSPEVDGKVIAFPIKLPLLFFNCKFEPVYDKSVAKEVVASSPPPNCALFIALVT